MKFKIEKVKERKSKADYMRLAGNILAARSNLVYRDLSGVIQRSTDNGTTWANCTISIPVGEYAETMHINPQKIVLLFTSEGTLFRSTDGLIFTLVDDSAHGGFICPYYHGIDSKDGGVIIFSEYTTGTQAMTLRVFRSSDNGITWTQVLAKQKPTEISHFHSVHYNELTDKWIVTSGDTNAQIGWWESSDQGGTWTQIVGGTSGVAPDQRHRTLAMVFPAPDEVIWLSDAGVHQSTNGVFRVKNMNFNNIEKITSINGAGFGIMKLGTQFIVISQMEGSGQDRHDYVYISVDDGKTFNVDLKWPLNDGVTRGGIGAIFGPTADASFFFRQGSSALVGSNSSVNRSTKVKMPD